MPVIVNDAEVDGYEKWLCEQAGAHVAQLWRSRAERTGNDQADSEREAALAEMRVRKWLLANNLEVTLGEVNGAGPDFKYNSTNGDQFVVEVTNLGIDAFTEATSTPDTPPTGGTLCYGYPYTLVRDAIVRKHAQARIQRCPGLIAVTTWHRHAWRRIDKDFAEALLVGRAGIAMQFDPVAGHGVGPVYATSDPSDSSFLIREHLDDPWIANKAGISAVVLMPLLPTPPRVFGCLNPAATYSFYRHWLPNAQFARLEPRPGDSAELVWDP